MKPVVRGGVAENKFLNSIYCVSRVTIDGQRFVVFVYKETQKYCKGVKITYRVSTQEVARLIPTSIRGHVVIKVNRVNPLMPEA